MENIADYYYDKLDDSDNVGKLLTQMIFKIFEVDSDKHYQKVIRSVNKAIKVFGKYNVYFSILAMSSMEVSFDSSIYPLLSTIILRRLRSDGKASKLQLSHNFSLEINKIDKNIKKIKEEDLILENPFNDK